MKNLDQVRASAAAAFWQNNLLREWRGDSGDQLIRSAISRVHQQGLLCAVTAAKNLSAPGHPGPEEALMLDLGQYLTSRDRALLAFNVKTTDDFLRGLASSPPLSLLQATEEALIYLGYLKRLRPH
jgi:hypothetical protein